MLSLVLFFDISERPAHLMVEELFLYLASASVSIARMLWVCYEGALSE